MDRLAENFSFMVEEDSDPIYCDISNGWYPLLENMCQEITEAYEAAGLPLDLCVEQVKQKWGELRFYFYFENKKAPAGTAEKVKLLHCRIVEIVKSYEDKSSGICEECGQPGELRDEEHFVLTLCDSCFEKQKAAARARLCADRPTPGIKPG